ncbi:hypothetical protein HDU67_009834 [Dinochytrium kinnereticum]|nr:hypothetical protein HDU67_009834 [Dinochytrium kinnereticum]
MSEQTVHELAAERKAEKAEGKEGRGCSVPIWLVLAFLMTSAIGAIVVPLGVIFVGTSQRSLNSLSTTTVQLVLRTASEGIISLLATTSGTLEGLVNSTYFGNDFTSSMGNVRGSPTLVPTLAKALNSHSFISAVVCSQPGQTAIGPAGPYTNRTNVQVIAGVAPGATGRSSIALFADPSTGAFVRMGMLDPVTYAIVRDEQINPLGVAGDGDVALKNMLSSTPSVEPYFEMSFYKNYWRSPDGVGRTTPDFACSVGSLVDASITVVLNSIKVTDNTIIMLMDESGLLLSTNRNNSISIPLSTTFSRVTPDLSPNSEVAAIGKGVSELYGGFASIPAVPAGNLTAVNQIRLGDGKTWFVSSSGFSVKGQKFTLVVSFPRSDMFAELDQAAMTGIIIASSVASVGVVLIGLLTFLSLRPLQRMASSMNQLTKFDFSSLENGQLRSRSPMTEIREVETVFNMMVVAFATAIRKNRALANGASSKTSY